MKPQKLALADIRTDGGTQSRAALSEDAIADYTAAYLAKAPMPPVVVFLDAAGVYWLADGFHRCAGAMRARQKAIAAEVRVGELRDAILHSVGANVTHGLRRTNADKRRGVETLLRDPEWSARSDRWVAETAGVHHETVAALRVELAISPVDGRRTGQDGKERRTNKQEDAHAEATGQDGGGRGGVGAEPGRRHDHDLGDDGRQGADDVDGRVQRVEGIRDAGADAAHPTAEGDREGDQALAVQPNAWDELPDAEDDADPQPPIDMRGLAAAVEWRGKVDALCIDLGERVGILGILKQALSVYRRVAADGTLHAMRADAIKLAIAEAIRVVEQETPAAVCPACLDPDGSGGRRETCGVCLATGFIVRNQEAGAVVPTKRKPARAEQAVKEAVAAAATRAPDDWTPPPKRPPPRNRIILQREDGTEAPFTPGEDW